MCTRCKRICTLPWRSMSQHYLKAKSCPTHNLVIWSLILKLCHRNDHHIETTCCGQDLNLYLEGQCHSITLQQNRVLPISLLFGVGFYNYFTEMITILTRRVVSNIWVNILKVKVTAWPFSKVVSGPCVRLLNCLLKSGACYNLKAICLFWTS